MTTLEIITKINHEDSYNVKKSMLEVYNSLLGRDYTLLDGRVVYKEGGKYHDLYANIKVK